MERRYGARLTTEVGVSCRVPASPERATLVDLSRSGCRLEFARRNIDRGATVNVDFRMGKPVGGEIVWTDGAYAGVRFHSRLPKPVAVDLGLEQREPPEDGLAPDVANAQIPVGGLLRHWFRRLTGG